MTLHKSFSLKKIDVQNVCKSPKIVCEISDLKDFTRDERRSISSLELILFHFVKESATREAERENQPGCKTSFARIQEKVEALTHSDKNLSMVTNNRYWINYFMTFKNAFVRAFRDDICHCLCLLRNQVTLEDKGCLTSRVTAGG